MAKTYANQLYNKRFQSAWEAHRDQFDKKLNNFTVGVVRSTLPQMLDRAEDFFVTKSDADIVGMNRYKVLA